MLKKRSESGGHRKGISIDVLNVEYESITLCRRSLPAGYAVRGARNLDRIKRKHGIIRVFERDDLAISCDRPSGRMQEATGAPHVAFHLAYGFRQLAIRWRIQRSQPIRSERLLPRSLPDEAPMLEHEGEVALHARR